MNPSRLDAFVQKAKPYSHWPDVYFNIRLKEYQLINSLCDDVFERGGGRFFDLGCGLGFACVYASQFFDHCDGVDVDAVDVAFAVPEPAARVGARLAADIENVSITCGDPTTFLQEREALYDVVFSHFVLEHVENLAPVLAAMARALKPGGKAIHVVPNTHDTIIQLLLQNLQPFKENERNEREAARLDPDGRRLRRMGKDWFAPITHSEFISDYRAQFDVNAIERFVFPLMDTGLKVRRISPAREHAYIILAEKPA